MSKKTYSQVFLDNIRSTSPYSQNHLPEFTSDDPKTREKIRKWSDEYKISLANSMISRETHRKKI